MQFALKSKTATAGTAIQSVIPASGAGIPAIRSLVYTSAGTPHTITVMRPIGDTTTTASSLSTASTMTLQSTNFGKTTDAAAELLAAADYLIWVDKYGGTHFDTVASVSGSVVTMTNTLGQDVAYGARIWACYELSRTTHLTFSPPVSTTTTIPGPIQAGFTSHHGVKTSRSGAGDPLLISVNNVTAAGTLVTAVGDYVPADNQTTV